MKRICRNPGGQVRRYPLDWILVSLAGIATNLIIAISCAVLLHVLLAVAPALAHGFLGNVIFQTAITNLVLVVFNLIPIPPLDGSRAFRFLLQGEARRAYDGLERWGIIILVIFISTNLGNEIVWTGVSLFARLLGLTDLLTLGA